MKSGGFSVLIFCLAFLLLLSFASAGRRHCFYSEAIMQPVPDLNFGDKFRLVGAAQGVPRETYVVPQGAKLIVQGINNSFVVHCVDGASSTDLPAVRLMEAKPDGTLVEAANNYRVGGEACDGGNRVDGVATSFEGFDFSAPAAHSFILQYKQSIASAKDDWKAIRQFDVLAAPGRLEITPFKKPLVGLQNNAYAQEDSAQREALWQVKNVGGIDVNITGIRAVECAGNLGGCEFTNYRKESGLIVKAAESAVIIERFSAKKPAKSPAKESLSIDLTFSDVFGFLAETYTSGKAPADQEVKFNVVAAGIAPYTLPKKPFQVEYGKTYYVQTCTDSARSDIYDPLFGATITGEGGNVIAGTNFHSVVSCSDPAPNDAFSLRHNNSFNDPNGGGGLKKFDTKDIFPSSFTGTKTLYYELGGQVGLAGQYRSDFLRIGTSFNEQTQLVDDASLVAKDGMGVQRLVYSAPTPYRQFSINAFDGTASFGKYAPALSDSSAGNIQYMLGEAYINGTKINSQPTPKAESGDGTIFINSQGDVFGRATVVGTATNPAPSTDVNLAWVDLEKYMFESKGLESGICRTAQGGAITLDGVGTATGQNAKVRIKYDWRPSTVTADFCDLTASNGSSNANYSYCDSTQFSIELVRKLKALNEMAEKGGCAAIKNGQAPGQEFYAYLMADGYSLDFQKDFDDYMNSKFFDDPLAYSKDPARNWGRYFSDGQRLGFELSGSPIPAISRPKLYKVNLKVTFDQSPGAGATTACRFFEGEQGAAKASVKVAFTEAPSVVQNNLLYYLPIDATVGTRDSPSGLHRAGYGTGFSGDQISVFSVPSANYSVTTLPIAGGSSPLARIEVKEMKDFATATSQKPAQILRIDKKIGEDNSYVMEFSPSVPVPIVILAEADRQKNSISAAYQLFEGAGKPIAAGPNLARLTEIAVQKGGRFLCSDSATTTPLALPALAPNGYLGSDIANRTPLVTGFDKQLSAFADISLCNLAPSVSNQANTYFFSRAGSSDANIFLQTMLYAPSKSRVEILNACAPAAGAQNSSGGRLYVKNQSGPGYTELKPQSPSLPLSTGDGSFGTLAQAIESIPAGDTCIVYGTEQSGSQRLPKNVGLWWNEGKLSAAFLATIQQKFAPNKFCGAS